MLTNQQIEEMATLESAHAAARVQLQARHANEKEALQAEQAAARKALTERLGLTPKEPAPLVASKAKRRR